MSLSKKRAALANKMRNNDATITKVRHPSALKATEPLPSSEGLPVTRIPSLFDAEREQRAKEWAEYLERKVVKE